MTQRAGQRLAPRPPSPSAVLGAFLPQSSPQSLACRGLQLGFPASGRHAGPAPRPRARASFAALPPTPPPRHPPTPPRSADLPAVGRVSNRMPSPSCLRGRWDVASPELREPGCEEEPSAPPPGHGAKQDTGRARSPVGTKGLPDPCPGIVCLRMSHLQSPCSHPSLSPLPAAPCAPAKPVSAVGTCPRARCQLPVPSAQAAPRCGRRPWPVSVPGPT